jgi:hypothetical protein
MPDVKARLQAVEMLLSQGIGRAPTAPELTTLALPHTAAEVQKMSWVEMQYVFSLTYADELREVAQVGGREALRERLAALSEDERRVFREALAELPG